LQLAELGLPHGAHFLVEDALTGSVWHWHGAENYVRLDPQQEPAHLFVVRPA
jgi:starch synthase (maltosyl-transferring)